LAIKQNLVDLLTDESEFFLEIDTGTLLLVAHFRVSILRLLNFVLLLLLVLLVLLLLVLLLLVVVLVSLVCLLISLVFLILLILFLVSLISFSLLLLLIFQCGFLLIVLCFLIWFFFVRILNWLRICLIKLDSFLDEFIHVVHVKAVLLFD